MPGRIAALALILTLSGACAPANKPVGGQTSASSSEQPSLAPKVLTVAILGEPDTFLTSGPGGGSGGENNVLPMVQDHLVVENSKGVFEPRLAAEHLSVEAGTWRINPDGTMDTIWKLQPGVKWHDGTRFTADDMVLTFEVYRDPASSTPGTARPYLSSASAPDPLTFVMRWSTVRADADRTGVSITSPVPTHRVGDLFAQGDRVAFENNPQFFTEFVGLGPYRLVHWERGSQIELARFDDYYRGRPPFDRIVVKFMSDPNAMVSAILSGAVDAVLPVGVDLDAALEVKRRWGGSGNQVRFDVSGRLQYLEPQYRTGVAVPRNGFTIRDVRQGFYQGIDRVSLAEVATQGLAPVADSWVPPADALYPEVEASIPKFAHDPSRAQRLLAQAGWVRGPDGFLAHSQSGEPFETELRGSAGEGAAAERLISVIASQWQTLGARAELRLVSVARLRDREYRALHPGLFLASLAAQRFTIDAMHSRQVASAASRWGGFNRAGYSNPNVDAVLDMLSVTIQPRERVPLHRQLLQEQLGDLALLPLLWDVVPTLMVKGVEGPVFYRNNASWNIMQWDKD